MPPHAGHRLLIDFARHYVDQLTVLVCSLPDDPIPGALRYDWLRQLYPDCRVVHVTDDLPQRPEDHPDFYPIWQALVDREMPRGLDLFVSSERYGQAFADYLGVGHIAIDVERTNQPISGTEIRRDPFGNWDYLPRIVRPYFLKRVCLFGPESTGKSVLAQNLARHFQTVHVPEFARPYLDPKNGECAPEDIEVIARGQIALEQAVAFNATKLLICDTDALLTTVWSRMLFDRRAPEVEALAARQHYDLTLFTDVDAPWIDDGQRNFPDRERRRRFGRLCEQTLRETGRPYVRIAGDWRAREAAAVQAIREHVDIL